MAAASSMDSTIDPFKRNSQKLLRTGRSNDQGRANLARVLGFTLRDIVGSCGSMRRRCWEVSAPESEQRFTHWPHIRLMLSLGGRFQIHRSSAPNEHRHVVPEIKFPGNAIHRRKSDHQNGQRNPASVQTVAPPACYPAGAHPGSAFNNGGVAAHTAYRQTKNERPARLPAKVQSPTHPQRART